MPDPADGFFRGLGSGFRKRLGPAGGARDDPLFRLTHRWADRLDAERGDRDLQTFRPAAQPFLQGKVEERGITTHYRISTTYRLLGEFLPRSPLAATPDALWDDLQAALEIRNRVVHPKRMRDLEVKGEEAMLVAATGDEFCGHLNQFVQWLVQKEQKLVWEHMAERRRLYPKIGRNEKCPCGSELKYKDCCIAATIAA